MPKYQVQVTVNEIYEIEAHDKIQAMARAILQVENRGDYTTDAEEIDSGDAEQSPE